MSPRMPADSRHCPTTPIPAVPQLPPPSLPPSRATSPSPPPPFQHDTGQALPFRRSLLATLGVAFVTMLVALDQTVVGTALPTIVADLQGFRLYAWIATAYLLASVVTVPIFGRLGDDFGRKPFVLASIVIFLGASAFCGLSSSMPMLVAARALQGIGGGMLVGTAFACIPDLFPEAHVRLRWQGILSAAFGVANAIGPTLGGVLTQGYGWRAVFFVNLPIGLLSLYFVWRYLPWIRHRNKGDAIRLDWGGAGLLAVTLGTMQLAIEQIPKDGLTLSSSGLLLLMVLAALALWRWEMRSANPILPLAMFANPNLSSLFVLAVIAGFSMFSLLFYVPLLFQGGFGMSPGTAGLAVTPLVLCVTVGSIVNARLVTRLRSPKVMMYIGFGLVTICCIGVMLAHEGMPAAALALWMGAGGLGFGSILPLLTIFGQEQAGRKQLGTVTAMLQSLRMIGGMMGTALTGALVTHFYVSRVRVGLEHVGAMPWFARVSNPQILVDVQDQTRLLVELGQHGHNGAAVLDLARAALVNAIHVGIGLAALIALWGIWQTRKVPAVQIRPRSQPDGSGVPSGSGRVVD